MQKLNKWLTFIRRQPRWRFIAAAAAVVILALLYWGGGSKISGKTPFFTARRGALEINVLEGGSLQALESQEVKCEARVGYQGTKILKVVEEGYMVTEDDVRTNKILVDLDSSEFQKQLVQQEIQFQQALASLIDAQQGYEIQLNQNQSDVKDAEQKARFARLDFDKFLGDTVTSQICQEVGLDKLLAAASTNNVEDTSRAQEIEVADDKPPSTPTATAQVTNSTVAPPLVQVALLQMTNAADKSQTQAGLKATQICDPSNPSSTNSIRVDFSKYASLEKLGDGEAKQKVRKFEDDLQVAQKELGQAKTKLDGTRRLFDKGFVTQTEMQQDEIAYENSRLKVQTAESAQDLFLKYDFLKSAEESLSKFADAVRELDKARRVAISKLAQAKAKLKSAQGQYQVQQHQLDDLKEQIEKCTMRAKKTGLVVYGGAGDERYYYGNEEPVREGATVRERQAIITIPDMSRMSVKVKIHESYIKKIKKGQKARITVDAFPDKVMTGEVTKVGVLPDSQNRWMNPDMKVYLTTITVDGTQDWTKPGMSAKVEILVNKIDDCVYVPVQAVSPDGDNQVCFVAHGIKPEKRTVEIGEFNDEFIQLKGGLKEGERVFLRPPEGFESEKPNDKSKPPAKEQKAPAVPAVAPAPVSAQASKA